MHHPLHLWAVGVRLFIKICSDTRTSRTYPLYPTLLACYLACSVTLQEWGFLWLGARPSRCHSAHTAGIAHIHADVLKHRAYTAMDHISSWFWAPTGLQMKPHEPCLTAASFWRPPWAPGTLLCWPTGPTLLCQKAAPAYTGIWGYPASAVGLFGQTASMLLNSSPVLQPISLDTGMIQGGCCFPLPSSNTFFQAFQKVKTSQLCFLLPLSESPHTRGFITKWNKNLCMTESDYMRLH